MTEAHLNTLRVLEADSTLSQRDISRLLQLSLGRVNYILNALVLKGYVKTRRFKNSRNKLAYKYILTPEGIRKKFKLTAHFIQRKSMEYEVLADEIEELKREIHLSAKKPLSGSQLGKTT